MQIFDAIIFNRKLLNNNEKNPNDEILELIFLPLVKCSNLMKNSKFRAKLIQFFSESMEKMNFIGPGMAAIGFIVACEIRQFSAEISQNENEFLSKIQNFFLQISSENEIENILKLLGFKTRLIEIETPAEVWRQHLQLISDPRLEKKCEKRKKREKATK